MNPSKNMKDLSTNELTDLMETLESMTKYNDNAKVMVQEVKKEIDKRKQAGLKWWMSQ
jgi:hypothetical protein